MTRWFCVIVGAVAFSLLAYAEEWPRFRGPTGQGISHEKNLPTKWSASDNIAWKAEIPGEGWSSPIVWGDRVFLTGATDGGASCHVLALSRLDGKTLWDTAVFRQSKGHKQAKNSYATPTPVSDGEHVYAAFNDGGIAALTVKGEKVWVNQNVKHYSEHGLASSPLLYDDVLIMCFDGSIRGPDKKIGWQKPWDQAFLLALDKKTGKERWRATCFASAGSESDFALSGSVLKNPSGKGAIHGIASRVAGSVLALYAITTVSNILTTSPKRQ